jgi:trehalose 6-phosphate synthase/phosphatase
MTVLLRVRRTRHEDCVVDGCGARNAPGGRRPMNRILIVSNRLPVSVARAEDGIQLKRSAGGLATGLAGVHARSHGVWVGWPGDGGDLEAADHVKVNEQFEAWRLTPVELSREEVEGFYESFCNGVLWPVLHYLVGQLPFHFPGFELYEKVNRRFAEAVVHQYRPGDLIWIHDYQLMLLPQMIRERLPDARIGFFLHVPFPASDVFRVLPFREQLLAGLLGADQIGFHTAAYMRHFGSSTLRSLGAPLEVNQIRWQGRRVEVGVFPMGVDAQDYDRLARTPAVEERVAALRGGRRDDMKVLVGIDRLDYTKGIPRRLLAFETLLRRHPELRGAVKLLQVAVPSRTNVDKYREFRDQVHTLIGRINGEFGTPAWTPLHYIYRNEPPAEVVSLYRAADALLVTPLRDGMNLVAKEFVASRVDEDGVLLLSEFAGAASELAEAVQVNPYDIDGTAEAIHRALLMPTEERRSRMRALRARVLSYDVNRWSGLILDALHRSDNVRSLRPEPSEDAVMDRLVERALTARPLVLLLDYDGTLVPFAQTPDLARPDPEAVALLGALAARPDTEVHVVSGRSRETLEQWLGDLPIHLHAEHGLWSRPAGGRGQGDEPPPQGWRRQVLAILWEYASRTPGSLVEEKPAGLAWHYRAADPEFGALQANELRLHLHEILSNAPVEILAGNKVIEVRPHGVNKGRIVPGILRRQPNAWLLAIGDDRTDEDLFAVLPAAAASIHVGSGHSRASYRLPDVWRVRKLLRGLIEAGAREQTVSVA